MPARYPVPRTRPRAVPARYRGPAVDFGRLRFANRRYRRYLLLGFALIPVSYTHLDVYKRQYLHRVPSFFAHL